MISQPISPLTQDELTLASTQDMNPGMQTSDFEKHARELGKTGILLYPVGLGAMPLSVQGRPTEAQGIRVIHAALEAGINLIDTADAYCLDDSDIGHNERLIRKALDQWKGAEPIVATKGGCIRPDGRWDVDGRPHHLRQAAERSLKNLGVETITLYQFHSPDSKVPFEESIGALAELQREGKIRHVGLSNVTLAQIHQAREIIRIESVQNECNVTSKGDLKSGLIAECAKMSVSYIAYSPVGGHFSHDRVAQNAVLNEVARIHNASPYAVMLAWLLQSKSNIIPIPGASRPESAQSSASAITVQLSYDEYVSIDRAF